MLASTSEDKGASPANKGRIAMRYFLALALVVLVGCQKSREDRIKEERESIRIKEAAQFEEDTENMRIRLEILKKQNQEAQDKWDRDNAEYREHKRKEQSK